MNKTNNFPARFALLRTKLTLHRGAAVALLPLALLLGACSDDARIQAQNSSVDASAAPGAPGTTTTTTTTVVTTRAAPEAATPTPLPKTNEAAVRPEPARTSQTADRQAEERAAQRAEALAAERAAERSAERAQQRESQRVASAQRNSELRGRVTSIEPVTERDSPSGAGAVVGGVLGGVLGNQVGGGDGRKAATVLGAVGGAVAGNQIEKRRSSHVVGYRVSVQTNAGTVREFQRQTVNDLAVGAQVRIVDGGVRPV